MPLPFDCSVTIERYTVKKMIRRNVVGRGCLIAVAASMLGAPNAAAAPPTPSGPHPRLFINASNLPALTTAAADKTTASGQQVAGCDATINKPSDYTTRGGSDGGTWPGAAVACAFAYVTTKKMQYLTQAIKYWNASLSDDQTIGDGLGCKPGVSTNWQSWNQYPPAPPVILTVTHDTGYGMRWYGPFMAMTYDWLHDAPGVSSALLTQTQTCLTAWMDYYTAEGYHNTQAASNYNAGFVVGKALTAIAIGTDGGADGHLWTETVDDLFANILVGQGLMGASGTFPAPAGPMVGGDWPEGWEYGPNAVMMYAMATVALEEQGVAEPEMDAWANSLAVRTAYGSLPTWDGQWVGSDYGTPDVYAAPVLNQLNAVIAGPGSDQAAAWALSMVQTQKPVNDAYPETILADLRKVTPQDYRTQTPAPSLWYLARGTRAMYVRTSWDASAFWAVFSSSPPTVSDHQHYAASNFVFTRGADDLVVDPSDYGLASTLSTNAVSADSAVVVGDYAESQTPWSAAELLWARGTESGVFAARSDFAKGFNYKDTASDIPYAHREWVMLPEGEIVTIDRVQTNAASRSMYVNFHTLTNGTLKLSGTTATGTVGGSKVVIHAAMLSGGTASITQPSTAYCTVPWGQCTNVRFAVDNYGLKVPGPYAVAIHAIDGIGSSEAAATVGSLNDDNYDPAPKQNGGVIGAAVYRASKQSYVVASSAQKGASGSSMTYGVPGTSAGRHVVFDAPEDGNGMSLVTAAAQGGRCVLTITAGAGLMGHPLMFTVASAADGCTVAEDLDVPVGSVPPGGGVTATSGSGGTSGGGATGGGGTSGGGSTGQASAEGGCSCAVDGRWGRSFPWTPLAIAFTLVCCRRSRKRRSERAQPVQGTTAGARRSRPAAGPAR
jgi:hypothetical protein